MTHTEIALLIRELKVVFDIVRLVDAAMTTQYSVNQTQEMIQEPYQCYAVWNRSRRCENCISAKAFSGKCTITKFEFIDSDIYFVISKYIEVEAIPYILEMVTKVTDQTLFGAYGRNGFIEAINSYNKKLYLDALTGAYNRQYYNEQLSGLPTVSAVAMLDVDNFKKINDRYGHPAGDAVLRELVRRSQSSFAIQMPLSASAETNLFWFIRISQNKHFWRIWRQSERQYLKSGWKRIRSCMSRRVSVQLILPKGGPICCRKQIKNFI